MSFKPSRTRHFVRSASLKSPQNEAKSAVASVVVTRLLGRIGVTSASYTHQLCGLETSDTQELHFIFMPVLTSTDEYCGYRRVRA
jgi:hypothetical protein